MGMGPKGIRAGLPEEEAFDFSHEKLAFCQGVKLEETILNR